MSSTGTIKHLTQLAKHQSPNLNAIPSRPISLGPGIFESSMRCPRMVLAIVALQQDSLVVSHARPVVPLALLGVLNAGSLASAVWVAVLNTNNVLVWYGSAIRVCQRTRDNWAI